MYKHVLSAVAAMGLSVGAAQAASISFSDSAPLADVEISGVLSVAKFDSSLGTLTGVSWEITGNIASILSVQNDAGAAIAGSAFTDVEFSVDSADLSLGADPDFNVIGTTGLVNLGVGASAIFPVVGDTTIMGSETPGASFLAPGTIDLSYLTATNFGGSGFGGDITISQATDAGISFTITYEYDDTPQVPLPAAAPLLAAALGGLVVAARRRRS